MLLKPLDPLVEGRPGNATAATGQASVFGLLEELHPFEPSLGCGVHRGIIAIFNMFATSPLWLCAYDGLYHARC